MSEVHLPDKNGDSRIFYSPFVHTIGKLHMSPMERKIRLNLQYEQARFDSIEVNYRYRIQLLPEQKEKLSKEFEEERKRYEERTARYKKQLEALEGL